MKKQNERPRESFSLRTLLRNAVILLPATLALGLIQSAAYFWWVFPATEVLSLILLLPVFFGLAVSIPFLFVLRFRFPFFAPYVCILAGIMLSGAANRLKYLKKPVSCRNSVCNPKKK